jgi:hypothetical protein
VAVVHASEEVVHAVEGAALVPGLNDPLDHPLADVLDVG